MKHFAHTPINIFIVCHSADFKVDFSKYYQTRTTNTFLIEEKGKAFTASARPLVPKYQDQV